MTTMTQQMQPAIGATGLMALNQSNEIASRYRDTTGISASETDLEEQARSVSITNRTPVIGKFAGKWVNHILHKYRLLKPLAAGADWYDEKNRRYATKQFEMALANGPKTKEGRQGLAYKTWGYLCDSGHDLLDLGSNIAGLYSFYLDVTQGLAVALAPFTEGASLIALPELKTTQGCVDILSTHLAVSATEAHGAFLDYQAVKTQDGVGSVASIESQYQENTTDRIFAYAAWALKTFKFLSPKKQISTVRQAGGFQSRAEQWISRMTTFLGSKIGERWPGFSKVGGWVQSLSKIYGYVKKIKSVGENIWAMAKDPALLLWKTAQFGLDVGKHAAIGAQHLGKQAIYYAAEKVKSGAGWLQNKASALAHFTGDKAQSAVKWMLPHFGGDGTKPLLITSMLGEAGEPVTIADGGKTGPFYPKDWKGKTYSSAETALEDSSRIAVYVNGVQTPLKRHRMAAQELAQQIGKPVVGIYNASGSAPQDFGQCATDKFGILGMGRRNAAIMALAKVISQHGSPAEKNGGLDLYAHSQGSIIVSEAIRQAKGQGHDVRGLDVTTFGNATWSRPEGLRGYHNYVYDSDVIATGGGSSSLIGALLRTRFNKSNPLNPFLGGQGMTSTADDTFALHHRGAGARPHGIIPDPLPGTGGLDSEDYYLKSLPKFRAKESATRAHLAALGPVGGVLESEALNRAMVTRSLAATSFAFAKSAGAWMAGKTESAYDAASGLVKSGYDSAADLVQTGYRRTEGLAEHGYTGAAHSVRDTYSEGAGGVAAGYGRMDGWMRRLPSLPFLQPNAVWGALDRTFRTGGSAVDSGLRGGGAMLDHGLQRLGKTGDMRWRGAGAVADFAARAGGSLTDRSLRRTGSSVAEAGRRGASAVDDYFDSTNAIQRKGSGDHPEVNPTALRSDLHKHSSGFLPDSNIRAKLGGHLGFDPGGARLHTGPAAAQASRALNAEAFTIGNDVFFGEGRFDPHTPKGLGLIAHELTHVGQQTGTTGSKARFFTEQGGDEMEREAQQTGERVLANAGSQSGLFVESYVREYEGEHGLSQADQQRLDQISLMALQQAQRALPAGQVGGGQLGALDIQVALDLVTMSDDEAAAAWCEAIVAAVQNRQASHESHLQSSLNQKIQKWDSFEHFEIGNQSAGGPGKGIFLDCFDRDFPPDQRNAPMASWPAPWNAMSNAQKEVLQHGLTYGDIVALSGDFYESPQVLNDPGKHGIPDPTTNFAALNNAPLREIMDLIPLIRRGYGTPAGTAASPPSTEQLQTASGGRYLLLAKNNPIHFTNPAAGGQSYTGTNIQQWQGMHRQAIEAAMGGNANLAWGINAAADHFLTDAFSSGHARTPRIALLSGNAANIQSKVLHDLDNNFGVDMVNPNGDRWVAYGDDNYHDPNSKDDSRNATNRQMVLKADALSKADITEAIAQGKSYAMPTSFSAERYVPHAVDLSKDRWTGRQNNPFVALAGIAVGGAPLTDYEQELVQLVASEGPGMVTGTSGDTLIRNWVQRLSLTALSRQPVSEKIRMINRLMEGWISDEDVDAIERLASSVPTAEEMESIRNAVTPQLPGVDRWKWGTAHRDRIRAAVNRAIAPPAPTPPAAAPATDTSQSGTQSDAQSSPHAEEAAGAPSALLKPGKLSSEWYSQLSSSTRSKINAEVDTRFWAKTGLPPKTQIKTSDRGFDSERDTWLRLRDDVFQARLSPDRGTLQRSALDSADAGPQEQAAQAAEAQIIAGMPSSLLDSPMERHRSPLSLQRKPAAAKEHLASAYFAGNSTLEQIYHGSPALRRGSHGKPVEEVQQALSDLNFRLPEAGVDGNFGGETEAAVQKYQTARTLDPDGKVGPDTLRALETDLNAAPKAAPEIATTDASLGQHVASDMSAANSPDVNTQNKVAADSGVWYQYNYRDSYPKKWSLDLLNGFASPVYFDRIAPMDWRLKPHRSASAAVKAWLKGLTIAECNSAVTAMEWDTLRASLGDAKFDEHFGAANSDLPEDQRLRINTKFRATPLANYMKRTDAAIANNGGTENNRPAKVGEWYYFYNHPQYLLKHPGGAWQGENSIFMGVNAEGKQIWAGLGASNVTEKGMYEEMIDDYNGGRTEDDYRELRQMFPGVDPQKHPEQLPDEYREGSGIFPSVIGVADVLSAPPYTIGKTTRKGGFVADAGTTLDTAKVQQTRNEP